MEEEEPPGPGGRRVVDAHREPDLTGSTDVDVLHSGLRHTRTRMLEEFRSPLADDALSGRVAIVTGGGTGIGRASPGIEANRGIVAIVAGAEPLDRCVRARSAGRQVLRALTADRGVESFLVPL